MPSKSRRYQYFLIFLTVFLLLFLGAMRVDPWISLVMAFLDTCWMILMMFGLERYLDKVNNKGMPRLLVMLTTLLIMVVFVITLMVTENFILRTMLDEDFKRPLLVYPLFKNTMLAMGAFLGATGIRSRKIRTQAEKLMQEKQDMELALLKSRMDPHFVFNALNVLYSLSYTHNEKTPEMIMKLAEMLRYITDECQADKVPVGEEVKYIENYLDFQQIRFGKPRNLSFVHTLDDSGCMIPPMILLPFVENSFKHGDITNDPQGMIEIFLKLENKHLSFTVKNTHGTTIQESSERDGVGITNVERRLTLYYPGKHTLEMRPEGKVYRVNLKIEL